MASADFWCPIQTPLDVSSSTAEHQISPGMTHSPSRLYLSDIRCIVPCTYRALTILAASPQCSASSASCSSGQRFAFGFLQIRSRPRHPCRSANTSPCRACRGLTPPSECALPGAPKKTGRRSARFAENGEIRSGDAEKLPTRPGWCPEPWLQRLRSDHPASRSPRRRCRASRNRS